MKKLILTIFTVCFSLSLVKPCADPGDPDTEFYNLFMQDIVDDPVYRPFLFTYSDFYSSGYSDIKNENIEEWQEYFAQSYDDVYYLVFNAPAGELKALLNNESVHTLPFLSSAFVKKHKEAIEYLILSKELEPYMSIVPSEDSWYYGSQKSVADLNYNEVTNELEKRYKSTKDKELKLRYGYQLVRFEHYLRNYEKAVKYFESHVEPLNHKPAMYYHALSQKAGAEKGLGNIDEANYLFLQVFVHSKNLKENAYLSLKLHDAPNWEGLVNMARNENERNDAYLLLGYNNFNNPLNEIKKIIAKSPDAIQAKILMARAVNTLEREVMPLYYYWRWNNPETDNSNTDKRYPQINDPEQKHMNEMLNVCNSMTTNAAVKDKNFWNITTAYLHFLNKDYDKVQQYLNNISATDEKYVWQKKNIEMLVDICKRPVIDSKAETELFSKYKDIITSTTHEDDFGDLKYNTQNFIIDVLANRYFLQEEYAKSFLLNNELAVIEKNPRLDLLRAIETFYDKPNKNALEKYIARNIRDENYLNPRNYINYVRGIVYLTRGDVVNADKSFGNITSEDRLKTVSGNIFGMNLMECFECDESITMENYYIADFPYIKDEMTLKELTETLINLNKEGNRNSISAPHANYLLGNFFYNTTRSGYYRNLLRFNDYNGNSYKYYKYEKPDIYGDIYFKYYEYYYANDISLARKYHEKAYGMAKTDELKAMIVFALSKCEQDEHNENNDSSYYSIKEEDILITGRRYFRELMNYRSTNFFDEAQSYCKYFDYYVSNYN